MNFEKLYLEWMDKLNNDIGEISLLEMSTDRTDTRRHIESLAIPIWLHLYKILIKPKNLSTQHWKHELRTFLDDIDENLRTMIKRFDSEKLYEILSKNSETLKIAKRRYQKDYTNPISELETYDDQIKKIISYISYELSFRGNFEEVEKIIENL